MLMRRLSLAVVVSLLSQTAACTPKEAASDHADQPADKPAGKPADKPVETATGIAAPTPAANGDDIAAPADVAAPPADAAKTASGLASKVLAAGTGTVHPTAEDTVEVHYTGWTTDGKMFDSSVKRGRTAKFPLGAVIKGWTEGLQLMVEGEKRRLWIPEELAYGGRPGKPAGMLVFDVELIKVMAMPKTPDDVAAAPKDATTTASGLAYKAISRGGKSEHPKATDVVEVHYAGWTTDGKLFDTSYRRGQPTKFPLNEVIAGWTEGVQLMSPGDKFRFWIPGKLAYGDVPTRPGAPAGTLVFDVELLTIGQ